MKTRAWTTASAAAAAIALTTTACAFGGGGGADDGSTTITFLSWDGETQMEPLLDAFEAAHPDIQVEASYAPPVTEYIQTLQTRVLSGTAPDVFIIAAENKTNLIDGGHVVDLAGEAFLENVQEFNLETYGKDGGEYGLSLGSWAGGYIYNTEVLAEFGYDSLPTTWDEFLAMCQEMQAAGVTPFLEPVDGVPTSLVAMLGSKTAEMDPSMDTLIFDGQSTFAEEWTPALEQYNRLFAEDVMTTDVVGLDGDQVVDEFVNGRVAVIAGGPWNISGIRESAPDLEFEFGLVPGVEGRAPYASGAASPGYAISSAADAEQQEAAKQFLAWLATPEAVEIYSTATGTVTVTSDYEPVVDPAYTQMADQIRSGSLYLPMISWTRSEDVLLVEAIAQLQRMVQGQITPEQMAASLDTKLAAS